MHHLAKDLLAILPGDWEPIDHRSPLPRVETSPVWPVPVPQTSQERLAELQRVADGERLWRLVQEAAGAAAGVVEEEEAVSYPPYEFPSEWVWYVDPNGGPARQQMQQQMRQRCAANLTSRRADASPVESGGAIDAAASYPPYGEWSLQPIYYPAQQPQTFVFPVYEIEPRATFEEWLANGGDKLIARPADAANASRPHQTPAIQQNAPAGSVGVRAASWLTSMALGGR